MTIPEATNGTHENDVLRGSGRVHAVVIPHPSHGHITPTLQLAKKLSTHHGFRITFVNIIHGERVAKSPFKATEPQGDIEFVSVPDGLPVDYPRRRNYKQWQDSLEAMGPTFEELLISLAPVTCVIRDFRCSAPHGAAKKLGIPVVGLGTSSAMAMQCLFKARALKTAGIIPLPGNSSTPTVPQKMILGRSRSEEETRARNVILKSHIPGASPTLQVKDLPGFILAPDLEHWYCHLLLEVQSQLMPDCAAALFNTFQELEGDCLHAMQGELNANIFGVGPLSLGNDEPPKDQDDTAILSWLDAKSPKSVLFVSFGTLATLSVDQMKEFALGLEMSGHPFLWVIRKDAVENLCAVDKEFQVTFSEFVNRTKDRALIVPWVPQTAVLVHPSVSTFMSHCGWNSTTESICSGVPMLGYPRFADQPTNCHYISHVWKMGLQLQPAETWEDAAGGLTVPRDEVDQKVRKMMVDEGTDQEVDEMRANAKKLQAAAKKSVSRGASSQVALAKFVDLVESWTISPPRSS